MENDQPSLATQNSCKDNLTTLSNLLEKTSNSMVILLNTIEKEKEKYNELFGEAREFKDVDPPSQIVNWVNLFQQKKQKENLEKKGLNELEESHSEIRFDGQMKMEVDGVEIEFPEKRTKEIKDEYFTKQSEESILFLMNNQFKTKSIGITAKVPRNIIQIKKEQTNNKIQKVKSKKEVLKRKNGINKKPQKDN